jgi:hypothetical protein
MKRYEVVNIGATNLKAVGVPDIQVPSNHYEAEKRACWRSTRAVNRTCSGFGCCRRPIVLCAHTPAVAAVREVSPQVPQKRSSIPQIRCIKSLCELIVH